MMTELTAEAWADALELYQYSYTSVSVVRREHEEWWLDAAAIMRGQTSDPRGWRSLDPDEDEDERRDDPLFPFAEAPTTPEDVVRFRQRATELPRSSVQSLIVLLGIPGLEVTKAADFGRDRPEMERRARLVLSRFLHGTRFYSNVGWKTDNPDFYEQPVRLTDPFSRYGWDAGLIAVNDAEVAMIWYFDPT
ncbi:hypothetical protein [Streptomyces sp. NRRL S-237]|uniref:hypothetical protein n=1 Tax=Streptomyces sp. NRRL S-237 TaxID=1463895 RepID=UPI0006892257|nr:hypothetical protein [Streptomyces sp. NRRL S-237]